MHDIASLIGLVTIVVIGGLFVIAVIRWLWDAATTDWFGIHYDDPTSPYYHDKKGKGRGRDS